MTEMSEQGPEPSARLRWRCRRGMRELDVLLGSWLERRWLDADTARRDAFAALLDCEDDEIWDWLTGHEPPRERDPALEALIRELRAGVNGFD